LFLSIAFYFQNFPGLRIFKFRIPFWNTLPAPGRRLIGITGLFLV
jgi:hypothetical protein